MSTETIVWITFGIIFAIGAFLASKHNQKQWEKDREADALWDFMNKTVPFFVQSVNGETALVRRYGSIRCWTVENPFPELTAGMYCELDRTGHGVTNYFVEKE